MKWKKPFIDKEGWAYPSQDCVLVDKRFGWRCQHPDGLQLGERVDIGCFTYLNAKEGIVVGDDVQIGSHCSIYSIDTERDVKGCVVIGDECLIGSYTLILPGVVLKPMSKVPAGSILK